MKSSIALGAEFLFRSRDLHRSTQKITALVPGTKVVWHVLDSQITFVKDKTEWTGTDIVFEITRKGDRTELRFTHVGLVPAIECYATDLATTPSGQIVILANCHTPGGNTPHTTFLIRDSTGSWLPLEIVAVDSWNGAIAVAGDGPDLRITALTMPFARNTPTVGHLIGKYLADPGPWQVRTVPLVPAGLADPGDLRWQAHHLSFTRLLPSGQVSTGLIFTWSDAERAHAYSVTSLDGGLSFGLVTPIVLDDTATGTGAQAPAVFAAPAYDPIADRLVAIWSCCRDALYGGVASTHYASWSVPGSARWTPLLGISRIPTIIGSRSAHRTATAQAPMSHWTWLAWVEGQTRSRCAPTT